jgi:hypothetical protein
LIAAAVAQVILGRGGFSVTSRVVFVALSALAAVAALTAGGRVALQARREPVVVVLVALTGLGAASTLWAEGRPEEPLLWTLLTAGYALLALAAAATVDATNVRRAVLVAICASAFVSGVVGLLGAATFSDPQAYRPTGAWRPAGTLEYEPALALLEVFALAPLLRMLCIGGRVALLAASPAVVAGAVLGLTHSRLGLALAFVVAASAIAFPRQTVRATRAKAVGAVALVVLAGVGARALLGGAVPLGAAAQDWRVVAVVLACVCAPLAWAIVERATTRSSVAVLACAVAGLVAAGSVSGFAGSAAPDQPPRPAAVAAAEHPPHPRIRRLHTDLLHGRGGLWKAGMQAFEQRPLQGHGADGFLTATSDLQHRPITSYAHSLPLEFAVELGLAGALLAIGLYAFAVRAVWRARRTAAGWLLGVTTIAFLAANLVDWSWHIPGMGAAWAAATGALIAGARASARTGSP